MWFNIPKVERYEKYKDKANESFKSEFLSTDKIFALAKEAKLVDGAMEELSKFCKVLENDKDLQSFIYLIYYCLYESGEKFVLHEYGEYDQKFPKSKEVEEKYSGMTELVIALLASEKFYDYIDSKGLSEYVERTTYNEKIKKWSEENKIKNGTYGLVDWGFFRHQYATGRILAIGRLVFEKAYFHDYMEVYRKGDEYIKIATKTFRYNDEGYAFWECENTYSPIYEKNGNILKCQTFDENGLLKKEIIKLNLDEYKLFLDRNTKVLNIHIPDGKLKGPLLPELVDKSLEMAKIVIEKEGVWQPKAFTCSSWMVSPSVKNIIKPTSNIYKFMDRFDCMETTENAYSLFGHIFNVTKCPIDELVPKNDFQQRILDMIKSGKPLRTGHGFIKKDF